MNCGLPLRSINVAFAGNAIDNGAVASVRRVMGLRAWAVAASRAMLSAMLHLWMQQLLCRFAAAKCYFCTVIALVLLRSRRRGGFALLCRHC